jgi:hypothetical protein
VSEPRRPGLDPDRAAELARRRRQDEHPGPRLPKQPIDTRRYQRMIGGFGLLLVVIFSIYIITNGNPSRSPGIPAGRQIQRFVAPLATSNLNVPANLHPRCNPARPARRGLNVCGRHPLVLGFFVTGAAACVSTVDALQSVSRRFRSIQFAAVAVNATRSATDKLVRRHHWTIPVAYDLTGAVGQAYGVEVCPIIELVRPGGVVQQRLIGYPWRRPGALAPRVARLAATL